MLRPKKIAYACAQKTAANDHHPSRHAGDGMKKKPRNNVPPPIIDPGEFERAKAWRFRRNLTMEDLSKAIGYSVSLISWMERGQSPPQKGTFAPRPLNPYAWMRYRLLCELVERRLRAPQMKSFEW